MRGSLEKRGHARSLYSVFKARDQDATGFPSAP
ncbi:hypothetical protein Arad_7709 [Rhizobium rhizogenes K84]|uniref:Uncharacterized protein n=1 Tax=Rhizobium rhizogenes (strain K84 / ATCC BAA-868) TaxID=311403 RepID=B9JNM3_RHIR8|nr:hypothetical protein Arad_7709 [Rhizobium rhizogenes K84]